MIRRRSRPIPEVRFAADPESFFASFLPAEEPEAPPAKHAAKPGWFARLRAAFRPRHQPVHTAKVSKA